MGYNLAEADPADEAWARSGEPSKRSTLQLDRPDGAPRSKRGGIITSVLDLISALENEVAVYQRGRINWRAVRQVGTVVDEMVKKL